MTAIVFLWVLWKGCISHKWHWCKWVESGFLLELPAWAGRAGNSSCIPSSAGNNLGARHCISWSLLLTLLSLLCLGGVGWTVEGSKHRLFWYVQTYNVWLELQLLNTVENSSWHFYAFFASNIHIGLLADWQREEKSLYLHYALSIRSAHI